MDSIFVALVEQHNDSQVFRRHIIEGAKYGAISGLWPLGLSLQPLQPYSELELGLPISTFYAVMGTSLGSNDFVTAPTLGFGLPLATELFLGVSLGD